MVGVLGYPLSAAVPQSGVLRPLWAEGLAQPLPHPTLSIIHASSPVSTTWQAPQQQGQGLFTVSKCLFAGSGPLPSRLPHQSSTLQEATWVMEAKSLNFLLAQPGPCLATSEHKMWTPYQGSALFLPWCQQSRCFHSSLRCHPSQPLMPIACSPTPWQTSWSRTPSASHLVPLLLSD